MSSEADTYVGRVKWFNTKAGYGFVSYKDNEGNEQDIFAHHAAIKTEKELFRYLVQGEYINFTIEDVKQNGDEDKHSTTAGNITGINGGMLMCETRNTFESRDRNESNPQWMLVKRGSNKSTGRGGNGRGGNGRGGRGRGGGGRGKQSYTTNNSFDE